MAFDPRYTDPLLAAKLLGQAIESKQQHDLLQYQKERQAFQEDRQMKADELAANQDARAAAAQEQNFQLIQSQLSTAELQRILLEKEQKRKEAGDLLIQDILDGSVKMTPEVMLQLGAYGFDLPSLESMGVSSLFGKPPEKRESLLDLITGAEMTAAQEANVNIAKFDAWTRRGSIVLEANKLALANQQFQHTLAVEIMKSVRAQNPEEAEILSRVMQNVTQGNTTQGLMDAARLPTNEDARTTAAVMSAWGSQLSGVASLIGQQVARSNAEKEGAEQAMEQYRKQLDTTGGLLKQFAEIQDGGELNPEQLEDWRNRIVPALRLLKRMEGEIGIADGPGNLADEDFPPKQGFLGSWMGRLMGGKEAGEAAVATAGVGGDLGFDMDLLFNPDGSLNLDTELSGLGQTPPDGTAQAVQRPTDPPGQALPMPDTHIPIDANVSFIELLRNFVDSTTGSTLPPVPPRRTEFGRPRKPIPEFSSGGN